MSSTTRFRIFDLHLNHLSCQRPNLNETENLMQKVYVFFSSHAFYLKGSIFTFCGKYDVNACFHRSNGVLALDLPRSSSATGGKPEVFFGEKDARII